jgi:hypothetical protein
MKSKNDCLRELTIDEQKEINGGVFGIDDLIIGIAVGAALEIISDWDNFKRGLAGQPEIK